MRNSDVVKAFLAGQPAHVQSLVSTGTSLFSYGWWEMARHVDGKVIKRTGKSYSVTTSHHIGLVYGEGVEKALNETPVGDSAMFL